MKISNSKRLVRNVAEYIVFLFVLLNGFIDSLESMIGFTTPNLCLRKSISFHVPFCKNITMVPRLFNSFMS